MCFRGVRLILSRFCIGRFVFFAYFCAVLINISVSEFIFTTEMEVYYCQYFIDSI